MNKPANEPLNVPPTFDSQLRYVSKRRFRTLRARHKARGLPFHWRACEFGPFYSWLRPV